MSLFSVYNSIIAPIKAIFGFGKGYGEDFEFTMLCVSYGGYHAGYEGEPKIQRYSDRRLQITYDEGFLEGQLDALNGKPKRKVIPESLEKTLKTKIKLQKKIKNNKSSSNDRNREE